MLLSLLKIAAAAAGCVFAAALFVLIQFLPPCVEKIALRVLIKTAHPQSDVLSFVVV
jgi:hypothetical protein